MSDQGHNRIVLAITGASGAIYAIRLLDALCRSDLEVHLTISPSGAAVIREETGLAVDVRKPNLVELIGHIPSWSNVTQPDDKTLADAIKDRIHFHQYDDYMTPIAR